MSNSFYGKLVSPSVEAHSIAVPIYATINTTELLCGWKVLQDVQLCNNFVHFSRMIVMALSFV